MPSARQMAANQRNALKCTGPRTPEGKAKSRFNSLKHGLSAQTMVLPLEDAAAYHELRAQVINDIQPESSTEWMIADQLASSWWRTLRARKVENGMFKIHTQTLLRRNEKAPLKTEEEFFDALAVSFAVFSEDTFKSFERHNGAIERAFYRAWDRVQKLKAKRPDCPEMGLVSFCQEAQAATQAGEYNT